MKIILFDVFLVQTPHLKTASQNVESDTGYVWESFCRSNFGEMLFAKHTLGNSSGMANLSFFNITFLKLKKIMIVTYMFSY